MLKGRGRSRLTCESPVSRSSADSSGPIARGRGRGQQEHITPVAFSPSERNVYGDSSSEYLDDSDADVKEKLHVSTSFQEYYQARDEHADNLEDLLQTTDEEGEEDDDFLDVPSRRPLQSYIILDRLLNGADHDGIKMSQFNMYQSRDRILPLLPHLVLATVRSFNFGITNTMTVRVAFGVEDDESSVGSSEDYDDARCYVVNLSDVILSEEYPVTVTTGSSVYLHLDPSSKNGVLNVVLGDLSSFYGCTAFHEFTITDDWHGAKVTVERATGNVPDTFSFSVYKQDRGISSRSKNLSPAAVTCVRRLLPLKSGDDILINTGNLNEIMIGRYKTYRTSPELHGYLDQLEDLAKEGGDDVGEIMAALPLWHFLANADIPDAPPYLLKLIRVFFKFNELLPTSFPREPFQMIIEGGVIRRMSIMAFLRLGALDLVMQFFTMVFTYVPTSAFYLYHLFDEPDSEDELGAAAVSKYKRPSKAEQILINFNQNLIKLLTNQAGEVDLSVLSPLELKDGFLSRGKAGKLRKVKTDGPYSSEKDYLDTYGPLLRTECFHPLQSAITDFRNGELNEREVDIYYDIMLRGYKINHMRTELCFSFVNSTIVTDWQKSKKLMHGNIVAISLDGSFEDVIWATVGTRDIAYLDRGCIIFLELMEANEQHIGQIIERFLLHNGQGVMIESPNYYQSFKATIKTFSSMNIEKMNIKNALLYGTSELINEPYSSDEAILEKGKDILKLMEKSQRKAFMYAMSNKVSVIQGPPGTGKTYVGAKIVEYLLNYSWPAPILVLTYKNHALDEFLKHLLSLKQLPASKLLRIGSKCKDEVVKECTLTGDFSIHKYKGPYQRHVRDKIDELEDKVRGLFEDLYRYQVFSFGFFLSLLDGRGYLEFIQTYMERHEQDNAMYSNIMEVISTIDMTDGLYDVVMGVGNKLQGRFTAQEDPHGHLTDLLNFCYDAFTCWLPDRSKLQDMKSYISPNARTAGQFGEPKHVSRDDLENEMRERKGAENSGTKGVHEKDHVFLHQSRDTSGWVEMKDFPTTYRINPQLLYVKNIDLWDLEEHRKYQLIFSHLKTKIDQTSLEIEKFMSSIAKLQKQWDEKVNSDKAQYIRTLKVVGATITGASLQSDLLQRVNPEIVIVEEAAEILEPSLLTCLNSNVKRLILIGDHEQLKPSVEVYDLRRTFNFDVSLLERLIKVGYPFKTLRRQARMRTEFASMLLDIYPHYCNLPDIDAKREPFTGFTQNRWWWDHNFEEVRGRSPCNHQEAGMVFAIVLYLIMCGVKPGSITVLAAYLGQLKLLRDIRNDLDRQVLCSPDLFNWDTNTLNLREVEVRTIDEYQGDENDFVVVSLVRSNADGIIGFLSERQRRCVAQSRARRGLYFVGDAKMFLNSSTWASVVQKFEEDGCMGPKLPLQCPRHLGKASAEVVQFGDIRHYEFKDDELMYYVRKPSELCSEPCMKDLPCGRLDHRCSRKCLPGHGHDRCVSEVIKVFRRCGHENSIPCHTEATATCNMPCTMLMSCEHNHSCMNRCGHIRGDQEWDINQHLPSACRAEVTKVLEECGHSASFECFQSGSYYLRRYQCGEQVDYVCGEGHTTTMRCYDYQVGSIKCQKLINNFTFPECGHKSNISKKCFEAFALFKCTVMTRKQFPECGHEHSELMRCGDAMSPTLRCKMMVSVTGKCGHPLHMECGQNQEDAMCDMPCERKRPCGHVCPLVCWEPCTTDPCPDCYKELQQFREKIVERVKQVQKDGLISDIFELKEFSPGYTDLQLYIKTMAQSLPIRLKINRVTKILSPPQFIEFEEARLDAPMDALEKEMTVIIGKGWEPNLDCKSSNLINAIRTCVEDDMTIFYPQGPSSVLYDEEVPGCERFLRVYKDLRSLGDVEDKFTIVFFDTFLGKVHPVEPGEDIQPDETPYDSFFVRFLGHVPGYYVRKGTQLLPKFIVELETIDASLRNSALCDEELTMIDCEPTQRVQNTKNQRFRLYITEAEAAFHRHFSNPDLNVIYKKHIKNFRFDIDRISIIVNKKLEDRYFAKKRLFRELGFPTNEILAFHATAPKNLESIVENNLDPTKEAVHGNRYGWGCYFSELPFFALKYGDSLVVFRVLPGAELIDDREENIDFADSYTSRKITRYDTEYGEQLLIRDNHQFMPVYIIHCKRSKIMYSNR